MARIKAVVFDSDGTLLDSLTVIVGAYHHIASTLNEAVPTLEQLRPFFRRAASLPVILEAFFPGKSLDELLRLNGEYIISHAQEVEMFAGILDLLKSLTAKDLKLAIVTGGNHKIHGLLDHHEITDYFTSVVHCDRVQFSKPHPEGFLLATEECGVRPEEAVMIGDSPNDILAGKNAKAALTIGITHGHGSRQDLQAADSDYIVDSVTELNTLLSHLLA